MNFQDAPTAVFDIGQPNALLASSLEAEHGRLFVVRKDVQRCLAGVTESAFDAGSQFLGKFFSVERRPSESIAMNDVSRFNRKDQAQTTMQPVIKIKKMGEDVQMHFNHGNSVGTAKLELLSSGTFTDAPKEFVTFLI